MLCKIQIMACLAVMLLVTAGAGTAYGWSSTTFLALASITSTWLAATGGDWLFRALQRRVDAALARRYADQMLHRFGPPSEPWPPRMYPTASGGGPSATPWTRDGRHRAS